MPRTSPLVAAIFHLVLLDAVIQDQSNPFAGKKLYVDPDSTARRTQRHRHPRA